MFDYSYQSILYLVATILTLSALVFGQTPNATLRGQVSDEQNAVIAGATVEIIDATGKTKTVETDGSGQFAFTGLQPGTYKIRATSDGFAVYENAAVVVAAGTRPLTITLGAALIEQNVNIQTNPPISTEPDNNAGSIVIKGNDVDALPDDPDALEAALKALAGPGSGPEGGQIFVDGLSGGRTPPKSSIREIRINSNPFSAEFDRVGFGRIEILTKPGTSSFHGSAFFNFNDESLNSRNPFATEKAPYQTRQWGGNFSGSLSKKASFFTDFERRAIDDLAVVSASTIDSSGTITRFNQSIRTPLVRTTLSPRFDYQLSPNNTLTARYGYTRTAADNTGVGGFSLASRGYDTRAGEHSLSVTDTAIINKAIVSETRFQFISRTSGNRNGDFTSPTVQVLDAFTSGGATAGLSSSDTKRWELGNNTSWTLGKHSFKAGARVRGVFIADTSRNNYNGTYTFTTLANYLANTPSQLTITTGEPKAKVNQTDFGTFLQDDWRLRPNLTLNLGLRYEAQTNVKNNRNFAPRLGFAWSPDANGSSSGKTVVRGGFGVFFDRVGENLSLTADRFDGTYNSYIVTDPALLALYPLVPTSAQLAASTASSVTYRLADNIRSPYNFQTNFGVERQLPYKFTVAANYVHTQGYAQLRARNINAPDASGVRPLGSIGNIFQYESTGKSVQDQLTINLRNNFGGRYSIFAMYSLGRAKSDTDGAGTFPANSYDLGSEYGRSLLDVRHRGVFGGTVALPYGFSLNPFIIVSSGTPYNITSGVDTNGDGLFNDRPTYAEVTARCNTLGLTYSWCGTPLFANSNDTISRNYARGPAFATVNLRLSKTFGFGGESTGSFGPPQGGGPGGPGGGGPGGPGGGSFGSNAKKYNLTFSLNANNLLNNTNAGTPIGNLSSPLFGTSNSLSGGFGPGGTFSTAAYNRKLEAAVRFSF